MGHGFGTLPRILIIPEKLYPIVDDTDLYRYFLLEGGRGGAKSQSIGRFLLYLGDKYPLRIVCGREIQKNIGESVYSLLVDLIREYNLNYEIFATKLVHRTTGCVFNFRGFREQGAFNIQGMEGVDIVWIDEAQAVTKQTLDVLIPTIRKDTAKIFFSMNRHLHDDPAYAFCEGRSDTLHIHVDYFDNPFCTNALRTEAKECQIRSLTDYNHIWLGLPLAQSEDMVYGHDELLSTTEIVFLYREGYGVRIAGFDIARFGDDKCACVILQQQGALNWEEMHSEVWDKKDLNYTTGRILDLHRQWLCDFSIIDEDGLGSAPLDTLTHGRGMKQFEGYKNIPIGFKENRDYANKRTEGAYALKDMIRKEHLKINTKAILDELEHGFRYKYDHYQRKILISKEEMLKKHHQKSPNLADALIYAVSKIGTFDYKSTSLSQNRQPRYAKEDNLFSVAGVR